MSKILPIDWSANVAMDNKCENERMKEVTHDLASLTSFLNFESKEMPINWQEEEVLMQSTTWLSWWIWHGVEKTKETIWD